MRGLVKLLVALLVVAVLAIVADRGADLYAERRAATALTRTLSTSPDVAIDGVPFLTQWGTGRFGAATVRADQVVIGGTRVNDFELAVADVRTPAYARTEQDVLASTAGSVRMTGVVPYGALPLPAGVTAKRKADSEQLRLTGSTKVFGRQVRFGADVRVSLQDGNAKLSPRDVDVFGPLPSAAVTALVRNRLDILVTPPGLPPGMKVSELEVTDAGLGLTATGRDVRIPKQ